MKRIWRLIPGAKINYSSVILDSIRTFSSSAKFVVMMILFGRQQILHSSIKSCLSATVKSTQTVFSTPQYWHLQTRSSSVCIFLPLKSIFSTCQEFILILFKVNKLSRQTKICILYHLNYSLKVIYL